MDNGVLISLILGTASIISSICFGLVPTIRKTKLEKLSSKVVQMAKDIKFFYKLEENYIAELSEKTAENKETIKKTRRAKIEKELNYKLSDFAKPSNTERQIQNM